MISSFGDIHDYLTLPPDLWYCPICNNSLLSWDGKLSGHPNCKRQVKNNQKEVITS